MEQQQVWDAIAKEWHKFKTTPAKNTLEFLKKTSGKVLDLGSGSGRNLYKIKGSGAKLQASSVFPEKSERKGKMYLVDFSDEMLKLAKEKSKKNNINAEFKQANLWELPYENEFFDYAICISALHCIEGKKNRENSVRELYRVLKKNGKALIGVWNIKSKRFKNSPKERLIGWTDKGKRYYYLHDEKEIHRLFKKIGFKIVSTHNSEMMINFVITK